MLTVGFLGLSIIDHATSLVLVSAAMLLVGIGVGMSMQNLVLVIQNVVPLRDLGAASGADHLVTRPVPLDVTYLGTGPDPWGGTRIALTAAAQLVRGDYDINWNLGLPGGFVLVGPTLRIDLEVQAVRRA